MERRGWLGGIKSVLAQVETTNQPRPAGADVIDIPNGPNKLRDAIRAVQKEITHAGIERETYMQAWDAAKADMLAAVKANDIRHHDAHTRLARLQAEWVAMTKDLGIRAEVVPPDIALPVPDVYLAEVDGHRDRG